MQVESEAIFPGGMDGGRGIGGGGGGGGSGGSGGEGAGQRPGERARIRLLRVKQASEKAAAMSWQGRRARGDEQRQCKGGGKGNVNKSKSSERTK